MSDLAVRAERYRSAIQREMHAAVGEDLSPLYAWMRFHLGWEDRKGGSIQASPGKMMRSVAVLLATEIFA